jgi:hypothetical protein
MGTVYLSEVTLAGFSWKGSKAGGAMEFRAESIEHRKGWKLWIDHLGIPLDTNNGFFTGTAGKAMAWGQFGGHRNRKGRFWKATLDWEEVGICRCQWLP